MGGYHGFYARMSIFRAFYLCYRCNRIILLNIEYQKMNSIRKARYKFISL